MSNELLLLLTVLFVGAIVIAGWVVAARLARAPNDHEELLSLRKQAAEQRVLLEALQKQSAEQWIHSNAQDRKLAALELENTSLKQLTQNQAIIIANLQQQLWGLASGQRRTGKRLREMLLKKLNENDLRAWAADLNIPFDNLTGDNLPALMISMLDTLERYGRLEEGLAELRRQRPDITAEDVAR
jgi:tRNA A37 threonylcarbamoyltransferase TsaD